MLQDLVNTNVSATLNKAFNAARTLNIMPSSLANGASNALKENTLQEYRHIYGQVKAHEALLQAVYIVAIENIYNLPSVIPWFQDETLCYLVSETDISLGSAEAESFHAGAFENSLLTKKTTGEFDMTFIETVNGDIANSYTACHNLAFNKDGTVNEPKKYAFKVTVGFLKPKNMKEVAFSKSWIVGVLSGNTQASSTGRSEVVKHTISFQKLRPIDYL